MGGIHHSRNAGMGGKAWRKKKNTLFIVHIGHTEGKKKNKHVFW